MKEKYNCKPLIQGNFFATLKFGWVLIPKNHSKFNVIYK